MKIRPLEAELFHSHKQTDDDEADSCLLQFCEQAWKYFVKLNNYCCMFSTRSLLSSLDGSNVRWVSKF